MQFTPLKDFFSPEVRTQYAKGLIYTVRPGNEVLAKLVAKWIGDNLVVEHKVTGKALPGRLKGKGVVKDNVAGEPAKGT